MRAIEHSAERDAGLVAMLPWVAELGWTRTALRRGLADAGQADAAAEWLFNGTGDMVEAYLDLADRRMAAAADGIENFAKMGLSRRVRALIALRLQQARDERAASRRAAALLALPVYAGAAARTLARTVDAIWHAAGDRSVTFSWYSKRAILAGIYGATLLDWLGRDGPDDAATLELLDRLLAGLGRFGRARARLGDRMAAFIPQVLRDNPPTTQTAVPSTGE